MAAVMLALSVMAGCASEDGKMHTGNGGENMDVADTVSTAISEPQPDTGEEGKTAAEEPLPSQEEMDAVLSVYRADREKAQKTIEGGYVLAVEPNEENYAYGVGDTSYAARFDTKELNKAFQAAEDYIRDTLQIADASVYACVDPRMTAIYDDSDKGVADGYDADNIFLCEYSDQGSWHYLILVREGKGADWTVLFHGDQYDADK